VGRDHRIKKKENTTETRIFKKHCKFNRKYNLFCIPWEGYMLWMSGRRRIALVRRSMPKPAPAEGFKP